jgi:acyl transferase domain-containing protein
MDKLAERFQKMTPLQKAVFALKETKAKLEALQQKRAEPIAVVGMACRFPGGANDPRSYWQLLRDGVDAVREIPPDRWDVDAYYDEDPTVPGKMNTRWGGFLDRVDLFDNHFFGISQREAERIDPQHRLVLELAWEALEDAGLPPSNVRGSRTGVFIGLSHSEYGIMLSTDMAQTDAFVSTGTAHCIAANRISFLLDLYGPSVTLDTACSSSLVTVHLACQSIRNGESDLALAGGVNVILSPLATVNLTKAGFSAPDGKVRAFDASATGYVRGEGAGMVVLKPLAAALKDKDPIYAVIRGSAVNQNGWSNGLTAPSRQAQERALREAYDQAKISPGRVQYVETQGTGTRLGDAIEAMALGQVIRQDRPPGNRCAIGSVKTNLGHLEAASGVASLMKVALALKNKELPPSLHFEKPNPDVPFDHLSLKVQQKLAPWPNSGQSRVAGVSAFGFGGSNAHIALEEPPAEAEFDDESPGELVGTRLLPLSARTEKALRALVENYAKFLRDAPPRWIDICYTAAERRDHHDCRLAVLANSPEQAAQLLDGFLNEQSQPNVTVGRKPYGRDLKMAFVYDGPNLARRGSPDPDETADRMSPDPHQAGRPSVAGGAGSGDPRTAPAPDWQSGLQSIVNLVPALAEAAEDVDATLQSVAGFNLAVALSDEKLWDDPARALPASVALQLALTAWWRAAGVKPDVVLGRGAGELAAACAAGILTAENALRIAVAGGRGNDVGKLENLKHADAALPFLSSLDGKPHKGGDLDPAHWQQCLDANGQSDAALDGLQQRGVDACVQIGPDTLGDALAQRTGPDGRAIVAVASLAAAEAAGAGLTPSLGALYTAGVDFRWKQIVPAGGHYVRVPGYPWQKHRIWAERKGWLAGAPAVEQKPAEVGEQQAVAPDDARKMQEFVGGQIEAEQIRERPDLNTPYVAPRTDLEKALAEAWAEILKIEKVGVHDNFFELGGDSLQATILLNQLQEQLGEVVHVLVLFQSQTIDDLVTYLREYYPEPIRRLYPNEPVGDGKKAKQAHPSVIGEKEVSLSRRLMDTLAPNRELAPVTAPKNPRAIFVFAPPRTGTTLLRVMMSGHTGLFAPPELELLGFDTMANRAAAYEGIAGLWLDGLVRAVMAARDCTVEEARELIAQYEQEGKTTQDFFLLLQEAVGDRILVDKTPSYSGQLHVLRRAEEMFDQPLYVHLMRHPCGMIRSFVDYKMHLTYNTRYKVELESPFSPEQIGELVWTISNQNILQALENVPAKRCHRLRFEDMVRQPEPTMRSLCEFLGVDYQEDMIHPYENQQRKMVDGVVAEGRMQGDQKFLVKHKSINPAVADAWKEHMGSALLGPPAREVAAELGYDDLDPPAPEERSEGESPADEPVALVTPATRQADPAELLQRLDHLSDEEVTRLLQQHIAEERTDG